MAEINNYYGFAHEIPDSDPRQSVWKKQREERGFDSTELWNLDITIAKFTLPRLKVYRDDIARHGDSEWLTILDKMIFGLEEVTTCPVGLSPEAAEGLSLFGQYFHRLWY